MGVSLVEDDAYACINDAIAAEAIGSGCRVPKQDGRRIEIILYAGIKERPRKATDRHVA